MKDIHLVLQHRWYDMIATGEKTEEYRRVCDYYNCRIQRATHVVFHRGYTNITLRKKITSVTEGIGNPKWGAPKETKVFIIKFE